MKNKIKKRKIKLEIKNKKIFFITKDILGDLFRIKF